MGTFNIPRLRLQAQYLAGNSLIGPTDVVHYLGAVQAQDYGGAKWGIAQRTHRATEIDMDKAFAEGLFLRTHVLRPTWHFVAPEDIRWLIELTAPRIRNQLAYYARKLAIDRTLTARTNELFIRALEGNQQLTRPELREVLMANGIDVLDPLRMAHLLLYAEIDGLICSGALRGKQHTYALVSERAPLSKSLPHDEALAKLALRYFTGHGPATLRDYAWWSNLSSEDARLGLELVRSNLNYETVQGQTYWYGGLLGEASRPSVRLLPNYDEYIVAYADRTAVIDSSAMQKVDGRDNILFNHTIVVNGQVKGAWRRLMKGRSVELTIQLFSSLASSERRALDAAVADYAVYLGHSISVQYV